MFAAGAMAWREGWRVIVWTHRNIIVPASIADKARELGAALTPAAAGLFETPLSESGALPASHFISSGMVDTALVPLLSDASALYAACVVGAAGQGIALTAAEEDASALVDESDVSEGDPFEAMARLALRLIK